jgi:hypothetical protein
MVRVLGMLLVIGIGVSAMGACGGGEPKPPMTPDNDTTSLGDGGPEMTPPATPPPPSSKEWTRALTHEAAVTFASVPAWRRSGRSRATCPSTHS